MKKPTKYVKKFRVRQRVRSASEPDLVFVIEHSAVPDRIYYGANRCWTKNEIQALGEPESPVMSLRLNGIGKMRAGHLWRARIRSKAPKTSMSHRQRHFRASTTL